jgi:C4-dicarboxylate-specific signal transduction histidine kinase
VAAVLIALSVSLLLRRAADAATFFLAAVMTVTWFAGVGPGLVAAVVATLVFEYFYVPPFHTFDVGLENAPRVLVFAVSALLIGAVSQARRRAEDALRQARDELDAKVQERTASLAEANTQLREEMVERERSEHALHKAQAELTHVTRVMTMGEITASIAHEVNQPLTAVVMSANACRRWLAADPPNLPEAREAVQRIISDGNRASQVIGRIRALLQKRAPEARSLNINDVIRETLAFTRPELARHQVSIRTELGDDIPTVVGDRVQLQQVLVNLILNGADAMNTVADRPRRLIVRSGADNGVVSVDVEDSGIGLAADRPERMFEAFYSTKPNGLGMGLSISRSIVEAHGGRLWATPNDGPGATLHFTLPPETGPS